MRRVDVPLRHVIEIVVTCIMLHNMCKTSKGEFDRE